jgi:hypothetical protein
MLLSLAEAMSSGEMPEEVVRYWASSGTKLDQAFAQWLSEDCNLYAMQ